MTIKTTLCTALLSLISATAYADTTPQTLPFNQNWSNAALIVAPGDWSGVPGIIGANGANPATTTAGVDPQTLIFEDPTPTLSVNANQTVVMSTLASGEVAEFETPAVVAFQGSGTADAPYLLITINTTGRASIPMSYSLRDIDDGIESAIQPVALQYRLGTTGTFTNIPAGFVADASTGPSLATLVTPVAVTLPSALDNQPVVQLRILTANASGSDEFIGVDDISIGGAATDVPPTVNATIPANNATGVAFNSNLSVSFSEAVTVTGNWFTISCATSGAHTAVVTGGPGTFTLAPSPAFDFGESCTLTIVAANVIDQDGTPDAMAANVLVNFTVANDTAPIVTSTAPGNGATGVSLSSNVTINFSEPVTVTGNWYTLSCALSGSNLAATVSGGPSVYVIDPTANLQNDEQCSFTVVAANVSDQDGTPTPMAANFSFQFNTTPSAANYYSAITPAIAADSALLRSNLHNLIDDHAVFSYFDAWTILEAADSNPDNVTRVLDVYKNQSYAKVTDRDNGTVTPGRYNREHTWPNSLGFGTPTGNLGRPNAPYTDCHMLYLSDKQYNADRGNKPYGNCANPANCAEKATDVNAGQGGGTGVYPGNSNWVFGPDGNTGRFEVWNKRKGDMARAILYMDLRYEGGVHGGSNGQNEPDLIVTDDASQIVITSASPAYMGLKSVLLAWHEQDPPDAREVERNGIVFASQGNRNPFIDRPEWVRCIFSNQCGDGDFKDGFESAP
jgi:endonuclease I